MGDNRFPWLDMENRPGVYIRNIAAGMDWVNSPSRIPGDKCLLSLNWRPNGQGIRRRKGCFRLFDYYENNFLPVTAIEYEGRIYVAGCEIPDGDHHNAGIWVFKRSSDVIGFELEKVFGLEDNAEYRSFVGNVLHDIPFDWDLSVHDGRLYATNGTCEPIIIDQNDCRLWGLPQPQNAPKAIVSPSMAWNTTDAGARLNGIDGRAYIWDALNQQFLKCERNNDNHNLANIEIESDGYFAREHDTPNSMDLSFCATLVSKTQESNPTPISNEVERLSDGHIDIYDLPSREPAKMVIRGFSAGNLDCTYQLPDGDRSVELFDKNDYYEVLDCKHVGRLGLSALAHSGESNTYLVSEHDISNFYEGQILNMWYSYKGEDNRHSFSRMHYAPTAETKTYQYTVEDVHSGEVCWVKLNHILAGVIPISPFDAMVRFQYGIIELSESSTSLVNEIPIEILLPDGKMHRAIASSKVGHDQWYYYPLIPGYSDCECSIQNAGAYQATEPLNFDKYDDLTVENQQIKAEAYWIDGNGVKVEGYYPDPSVGGIGYEDECLNPVTLRPMLKYSDITAAIWGGLSGNVYLYDPIGASDNRSSIYGTTGINLYKTTADVEMPWNLNKLQDSFVGEIPCPITRMEAFDDGGLIEDDRNLMKPCLHHVFDKSGVVWAWGNPTESTVVYHSKDGEPESFPVSNHFIFDSDVIAVVAAPEHTATDQSSISVYVFTKDAIYGIASSSEGKFPWRISSEIGISNRRAVTTARGIVFFVSKSGVYALNGGGLETISGDIQSLFTGHMPLPAKAIDSARLYYDAKVNDLNLLIDTQLDESHLSKNTMTIALNFDRFEWYCHQYRIWNGEAGKHGTPEYAQETAFDGYFEFEGDTYAWINIALGGVNMGSLFKVHVGDYDDRKNGEEVSYTSYEKWALEEFVVLPDPGDRYSFDPDTGEFYQDDDGAYVKAETTSTISSISGGIAYSAKRISKDYDVGNPHVIKTWEEISLYAPVSPSGVSVLLSCDTDEMEEMLFSFEGPLLHSILATEETREQEPEMGMVFMEFDDESTPLGDTSLMARSSRSLDASATSRTLRITVKSEELNGKAVPTELDEVAVLASVKEG